MSNHWKSDYQGYCILPTAEWSLTPPYKAHYTITKPGVDGERFMHHGFCSGAFHSKEAALEAATHSAQNYIDALTLPMPAPMLV